MSWRHGRVLDAAEPMKVAEVAKPCRYCREPTRLRTRSGMIVHPGCSPTAVFDRLSPEAETAVTWMVLQRLPMTFVPDPPAVPHPVRALRRGPCGWCGAEGIALAHDRYFHCRAHLFPPYRWPTPEETP